MLEEGQVFNGLDGDTIVIKQAFTGTAIGDIFWACRSFGPMQADVLVTEQGLIEASYAIQEPAPVEEPLTEEPAPEEN